MAADRQIFIDLEIPGREELHLKITVDESQEIIDAKLSAIGSHQFLDEVAEARTLLKGNLQAMEVPVGKTPGKLLLREAFLKAQGNWNFPYSEHELCHCRAVPTERVYQAILIGAHTPEKVSSQTSASTACGTCRPDVQAILEYLKITNS